jgi:threonine synthase
VRKTVCQACGHVGQGPGGRCELCGGVAAYPDPWTAPEGAGTPPTPLMASRTPGLEGVRLKLEGANLSGSFKDRVMGVLVDEAVAQGSRGAVVASSGNAAVAAASACARAGLPLLVLVPAAVSPHAVRMVELRGAVVVRAGEGPAAVHGLAARLAAQFGLANLASTFAAAGCEWACRGIGHEIALQSETEVHELAASISVGPVLVGAGRGLAEAGRPAPRLLAAQAAACAPIARAFTDGDARVRPWTDQAPTRALAIADRLTGYADEATYALELIRFSRGAVEAATDAEMAEARRAIARHDGIDVELASAAAAAVLRRRGQAGATTVCILTGAGVKETLAEGSAPEPPGSVEDFARRTGSGQDLEEVVATWIRESQ